MGKDQGMGLGAADPLTRLREDADPQWSVPPAAVLLESWNSDEFGGASYDLPPDLTPGAERGPYCTDEWQGWTCTRLPGHTRRHAAGDGERVCAVWP